MKNNRYYSEKIDDLIDSIRNDFEISPKEQEDMINFVSDQIKTLPLNFNTILNSQITLSAFGKNLSEEMRNSVLETEMNSLQCAATGINITNRLSNTYLGEPMFNLFEYGIMNRELNIEYGQDLKSTMSIVSDFCSELYSNTVESSQGFLRPGINFAEFFGQDNENANNVVNLKKDADELIFEM